MAKPRIFISSTYYDLKHIRSSLDVFISTMGYEPILSEKGDIAYSPDQPLDESCYREAQSADIFVLIIGGRYGSAASSENRSGSDDESRRRYESITKQEYKAALQEDIPIYILVESGVYSEYQTFRKNRDNSTIKYAHVDSTNVFEMLDEILRQKQNNPVKSFDRYSDIESWLRDQWAGLFRELLNRRSNQTQLAGLATQVSEMSEVNKTLRRYIEMIVSKLAPEKSEEIIKSENQRLKTAREEVAMRQVRVLDWLGDHIRIPEEEILELIRNAKNLEAFHSELKKHSKPGDDLAYILEALGGEERHPAFDELNMVRELLGLSPFKPKRRTNKSEQDNA